MASTTGRVAVVEITRGGDVYELPLEAAALSIGRAPDNDVVLDDPAVSRHHARIERSGDMASIVDLGSANSTRVNETEIEPKVPYRLREGDSVRIGAYSLRLRAESGPISAGSRGGAVPQGLYVEQQASPPAASPPVAPSAPASLVVDTPQGTREFPLDRDRLVLGRDPTADITIDDQVVSRRHAELRRSGGGYEIVDLGSTNGLAANGQRFSQKARTGPPPPSGPGASPPPAPWPPRPRSPRRGRSAWSPPASPSTSPWPGEAPSPSAGTPATTSPWTIRPCHGSTPD